MTDPLSLLRSYTISKKPIIFQNNEFIFGSFRFPRDEKTAFHAQRGRGAPYTLDALWFLLQQHEKDPNQKFSDFMNEARKQNFPYVSLVDKKELIQYLHGEIDSSPGIKSIDPSLPELSSSQIGEERLAKRQKKEEIQNLELEAPIVKTAINNEGAIELGDELPVEKSKEERDQLQRTTIKEGGEPTTQAKLKFIEADTVFTQDIIKKEIILRTRSTALRVQTKHFTSIIDTIISMKKKKDELKEKEQPKRPYDRYADVHEDRFWSEKLGEGSDLASQIDKSGGFADGGLLKLSTPKPISTPTKKPARSIPTTPTKKVLKGPAIIVVPGAISSLLTIYNAKDFLKYGKFITTMEKKKQDSKKESVIVIKREMKSGETITYHIIDNISKLKPDDWYKLL